MQHREISIQEAESRLLNTPPEQPYDVRQSIGYALAYEFSSEFESLYVKWRSEAITPKKAQQEAKGFRLADGSITMGSFLYHTEPATAACVEPTQAELDDRAKRREREQAKAQASAQRLYAYAKRLYNSATTYESGQSAYLTRKMGGLEPDAASLVAGLRSGRDKKGCYLIYQLLNGSYQAIWDDGTKRTYTAPEGNGKGYKVLGNPDTANTIYCVEGLATGLTVALATQCAVVVCLDTSGLERWAPVIAEKYAEKTVVVAADNDCWNKATGTQGGSKAGEKSAIKTGLRYSLPVFEARFSPSLPTDFNDLYQLAGLNAVKGQLSTLIGVERRTINSRYIKDLKLLSGLNIVKSPKGSGKTQWLKRLLSDQLAGLNVLIISYRISLNEQIARECNALCYKEIPNEYRHKLREATRLVISPDSLHKIDGSYWDAVIIDESEQVLPHFTSSLMKKHGRSKPNLDLLGHLLQRARYQIFLDADAGELTTGYACRLGLSGQLVSNEFKPCTGRKMFIYPSKEELEVTLSEHLKAKSAFVATSKTHATRLHEQHSKKHRSEIITSDQTQGSGAEYTKELIENITERSKDIDLLATSPAAGTGISIDSDNGKPAYDAVFVIAENTAGIDITIEQVHQHAGRVRDCQEYHVWLDNRKLSLTTEPDHIRQNIIEGYEETCAYVGRQANEKLYDEDLLWLECATKAKAARSKNNWDNAFIDQAKAEGYTVINVEPDDEAKKVQREANKARKEAEREALITEVEHTAAVPLSKLDDSVSVIVRAKSKAKHLYGVPDESLTGFTLMLLDDYEVKIQRIVPVMMREAEVRQLDMLAATEAEKLGTLVGYKNKSRHRSDVIKLIAFYGINSHLEYDGKTVRHKGNMKAVMLFLAKQAKKPTLGINVPYQASVLPAVALKTLNRMMASVGIEIKNERVRKGKKLLVHHKPEQTQLNTLKKHSEAWLKSQQKSVQGKG